MFNRIIKETSYNLSAEFLVIYYKRGERTEVYAINKIKHYVGGF